MNYKTREILKIVFATLIIYIMFVTLGKNYVSQHELVHQIIFELDGCDSRVESYAFGLSAQTIPESGCVTTFEGEKLHVLNELVGYNVSALLVVGLVIMSLLIIQVLK